MPDATDTAQMTLTDFLLERIAEDEGLARSAGDEGKYASRDWWAEGSWWLEGVEMLTVGKGHAGADVIAYTYAEADRGHIARHDPARVLAECDAKRRIVGRHTACDDTSFGEPCDDLRDLALPYAAHPDYREEWRG